MWLLASKPHTVSAVSRPNCPSASSCCLCFYFTSLHVVIVFLFPSFHILTVSYQIISISLSQLKPTSSFLVLLGAIQNPLFHSQAFVSLHLSRNFIPDLI